MFDNHIVVGKILKCTDSNGSLKVLPFTDFPDRFKKLKAVYLFDEKENSYLSNEKSEYFEVIDTEVHSGNIKIRLSGISTKEDALKLKNALICIEEKDRVPLPEGRFYLYELRGYKVKSGDEIIGTVEKAENFGSDDLLKVNNNGKYFYVPINEFFITEINSVLKEIKINLIEGLID